MAGLSPAIVYGEPDQSSETVIYTIKADQTSYINYLKPLLLAEELNVPYTVAVIDTSTEWAYRIHPERMVPCLRDFDQESGETARVFESTACLYYLGDRYDLSGSWTGRCATERAAVHTWTAYQAAGLGTSAKFWLYFLRGYPTRAAPEAMPKTCQKFKDLTVRQWQILENRLSEADQHYIALKQRPTIADISFLPFTLPVMSAIFDIDMSSWPRVMEWTRRMMTRPAIAKVLELAPTIGH